METSQIRKRVPVSALFDPKIVVPAIGSAFVKRMLDAPDDKAGVDGVRALAGELAKGVRRQWSAATLVADESVAYVQAFIDLLAARGMPARQRPLGARRRAGS